MGTGEWPQQQEKALRCSAVLFLLVLTACAYGACFKMKPRFMEDGDFAALDMHSVIGFNPNGQLCK